MLGQARRRGRELLILRLCRQRLVNLDVVNDLREQLQAERGQCALPQLTRSLALPDEAPVLGGYRAGIHAVSQVIDRTARDRVAFLDGPFDSGLSAVTRQERGMVADA